MENDAHRDRAAEVLRSYRALSEAYAQPTSGPTSTEGNERIAEALRSMTKSDVTPRVAALIVQHTTREYLEETNPHLLCDELDLAYASSSNQLFLDRVPLSLESRKRMARCNARRVFNLARDNGRDWLRGEMDAELARLAVQKYGAIELVPSELLTRELMEMYRDRGGVDVSYFYEIEELEAINLLKAHPANLSKLHLVRNRPSFLTEDFYEFAVRLLSHETSRLAYVPKDMRTLAVVAAARSGGPNPLFALPMEDCLELHVLNLTGFYETCVDKMLGKPNPTSVLELPDSAYSQDGDVMRRLLKKSASVLLTRQTGTQDAAVTFAYASRLLPKAAARMSRIRHTLIRHLSPEAKSLLAETDSFLADTHQVL